MGGRKLSFPERVPLFELWRAVSPYDWQSHQIAARGELIERRYRSTSLHFQKYCITRVAAQKARVARSSARLSSGIVSETRQLSSFPPVAVPVASEICLSLAQELRRGAMEDPVEDPWLDPASELYNAEKAVGDVGGSL